VEWPPVRGRQMGFGGVVKVDCKCRELQSRNSSDTGPEHSRCLADSVCFCDDTGRKPGKCAEVSLAGLKSLGLVVLRKQLTWRSRRYESLESFVLARASLVARSKEVGGALQDG
jgi:hypothetical protein